MAAITFGINTPSVDVNKIDSGALGNTSNSTTSSKQTANTLKSDTQTPQQVNDIIAKGKSLSLTSGTSQPNTVVDTNQLESATNSSLSLPNNTTPERIQVSTPNATTNLNEDEKAKKIAGLNEQINVLKAQKETTRLRDDVKAGFDSIGNIGQFEADLIDSVDLQKKKEAKTDIDNKINAKNREFDLALRSAQDATGTRAQKAAIQSEIAKNYNRELADLAIIQMARAGEYNDARSYVDEKVRLELQDRRANLDGLMFLYQENKERFTTLEQRQFEKKITEEERAYQEAYDTRKQLESIKATMTINAAEDGAGNAALQAIQGADSLTSLMSLPNSGRWSKSKADRLSEQLASIDVAKASQELSILRNPPTQSAGVSSETIKAMRGLNVTQQTNLADANDTVRSLNRLKEMVSQYSPVELENPATQVGQEFKRISSDVVDKMARDRTGAVVTASEEKAFKKILGLTFFSRSISGKEDVTQTLDRQIQKHTETLTLIDPTGDIRNALSSLTQSPTESPDDYLNRVDTALQTSVYGNYLK